MTRKISMQREKKLQCLLNCRYYIRCESKCGNLCKHLGGENIPRFRSNQLTSKSFTAGAINVTLDQEVKKEAIGSDYFLGKLGRSRSIYGGLKWHDLFF